MPQITFSAADIDQPAPAAATPLTFSAADIDPPTFRAQAEVPTPSMWERANTPLIPQIAEAAHAIANHLDAPKLDQSRTLAQIKGFFAGATTGAGDVAASFTSPVGIALMLTGLEGEGAIAKAVPGIKALLKLPAVQVAQRAVQATAGAGFAVHGADRVVTDPTLAGKAQGVVEMATGGLGMASALPRPRLPNLTTGSAADAAAVHAGQAAGVPVDLATASGNRFIRGAQHLADRSLGGSLVAPAAEQRARAAFNTWGDNLATTARATPTTAEQAGQAVRDALTTKATGHHDAANSAYEQLRAFEADPTNRMQMPVKPDPVAGIQNWQADELRRMVHELDASGYVKRTWVDRTAEPGKKGNAGGGDYEIVPGSGGAKVFDDINQRSGSTATRGVMQGQLEAYLGGGPETANVRAALEVAKSRLKGLRDVSTPELPPSAMRVPTRLEAQRVTSADMGLPVDLTGVKKVLRPVHDQMMRQLPVTQQQANPGLKALSNILEGPDHAPLSQVDQDLSAIKALARSQGGLAKLAVGKLSAAVDAAAANGGPTVVEALKAGREATVAKHATEDLIDALPGGKFEEPTKIYAAATAPKDGGIEMLRTVAAQAPKAVPQIARAKLEELLGMLPDAAAAMWGKLGLETRATLFPTPGHAAEIGHFFLLQKRMATNPNPSGSGAQVAIGVQAAAFWTNPIGSIIGQTGAAGLSAALHAPAVTRALTRVGDVSRQPAASSAMRAAALASLARATRQAGLPALVPAFGSASRPADESSAR